MTESGINLSDEHYLDALREAAYDWGIEPLDGEPVVARRAAIWLGRNVVTLIDEVRRLRQFHAVSGTKMPALGCIIKDA
jgi:hypothetical protein